MQPAAGRIDIQSKPPIGWLTLSNRAKRNALSVSMWRAIPGAIRQLEDDPAIRVLMVTGDGTEAFASGADLSELETLDPTSGEKEYYALTSAAFAALSGASKPLIAMIQGFCFGGGLGVALKADLRLAADDTQFCIPATRLGLSYPLDGLRDLVAAVGISAAKSLMFTARRLGVEEALRIGLIDEIVPAATLRERAETLAGGIAANAPMSVRAAKAGIEHLARGKISAAEAERLAALCLDSADSTEGQQAFRERRPPVFRGE